MATTRRPSRARPRSSKTAKARPAPARPSTPKLRAQGKPGAVSSKPKTSRGRGWFATLQQRLQAAQERAATAEANASRWSQRVLGADQMIQFACKRMRSVLGSKGQGEDGVSTTGQMLAMIEQVIEERAGRFDRAAREAIAQLRAAIDAHEIKAGQELPDDLTAIVGRVTLLLRGFSANRRAHLEIAEKADAAIATVIAEIRALLGETGGTPNTPEIMLGLVQRLIAVFNARQPADVEGLDRLQLSQLETSTRFHHVPTKGAVEATLAAVRADPPTADFGPRCEEKGRLSGEAQEALVTPDAGAARGSLDDLLADLAEADAAIPTAVRPYHWSAGTRAERLPPMKPNDTIKIMCGHAFTLTALSERSLHNRLRLRVHCDTCGVVVSAETISPQHSIDSHLNAIGAAQ